MKLYTIDDEYIDYLSRFDNLIAFNKGKTRPYVGIVLEINNINYFAPLYSPKPQHSKYKENPSFIRIKEGKLGIIRFSTMLPVPKECIELVKIEEQEEKYATLLKQQIIYINLNSEKIIHKAKSIYNSVTKNTNRFLVSISCDFKLLEQVYMNYKKIGH